METGVPLADGDESVDVEDFVGLLLFDFFEVVDLLEAGVCVDGHEEVEEHCGVESDDHQQEQYHLLELTHLYQYSIIIRRARACSLHQAESAESLSC